MDFILYLCMLLLPALASFYVNSSYGKNKSIPNSKKMAGFEVARKLLDENNLKDIYVVETKGVLTDHYDPKRKVIRLSSEIFHGDSIASLAVAAHECGHAIQDKENYTPLRIRSLIFPIVHFATMFSYIVLFLGLLMEAMEMIWLGICLVGMGLLFQLITLPVEFDASNRAKQEIKKLELANEEEQENVREMLTAAATTYVAGVLTSALEILRLILLFGRNQNRR